jgi:hypothetical protein
VSSRPLTQPEEEDLVDEGIEDEGRGGREGKRWVLQHHPTVILMKQEWRVKEKVSTPTTMTSDDDMDLLDDDEALLIKDMSPPPTGMDINMVFTLPAKFRGIDE